MIYYFFTFVCVACIALCAWTIGRVDRLAVSLAGQNASVAKQVVEIRKEIDELKDKMAKYELLEETGDPEMERRIAERIEKKWDDGLQALMDFNPLTGGKGDDE